MRRRAGGHVPPHPVARMVVVLIAAIALWFAGCLQIGPKEVPTSSEMALQPSWVGGSAACDEGLLQAMPETLQPRMEELISEGLSTSVVETTVNEAARNALTAYEAQGDCVLCQAGYLDLSGNAWGCVVQGDGWVEVVVTKRVGDDGLTEVTTIHMDVKAWERELGELGIDEEGS